MDGTILHVRTDVALSVIDYVMASTTAEISPMNSHAVGLCMSVPAVVNDISGDRRLLLPPSRLCDTRRLLKTPGEAR